MIKATRHCFAQFGKWTDALEVSEPDWGRAKSQKEALDLLRDTIDIEGRSLALDAGSRLEPLIVIEFLDSAHHASNMALSLAVNPALQCRLNSEHIWHRRAVRARQRIKPIWITSKRHL